MTPKEKAKELVDFYLKLISEVTILVTYTKPAKKAALRCVDEILDAVTTIADKKYDFYTEVKQEIEKYK